jgi:hypothetical protein
VPAAVVFASKRREPVALEAVAVVVAMVCAADPVALQMPISPASICVQSDVRRLK